MRYVVFGAAGFIGSHLVDRLTADEAPVVAVDLKLPSARNPSAQISWVELDAANPFDVEHILEPDDIVFALTGGAIPDPGKSDPRSQLDQTVGAALTLLEACRRRGVRRVLFPSSGGTVYGVPKQLPIDETHPTEPISAYGVQKLTVEKYLKVYRKLYNLDSVILRIANPFGPRQDPFKGQGLIAALAYRGLNRLAIEVWGDGKVIRDYLYIEDLVDAIARLARYDGDHRIFNVGSGVGVSVLDVIDQLESILGRSSLDLRWMPARAFDAPANVLSISRISSETGWSPRTSIADGIVRQLDWLREARLKAP